MLPLSLDSAVVIIGLLLALMLLGIAPASPPPPVVVVQAQPAESPGKGILIGLLIFALLVLVIIGLPA